MTPSPREQALEVARWNAVTLCIRAIERQVKQLDAWAKECADKEDYSGAGSNQKAAVDLHLACDIIVAAVIGTHVCALEGFNPMTDTCERCHWEAARRLLEGE